MAIPDRLNNQYTLASTAELTAKFPLVPAPVWDALRIRTCQPGTNKIKPGWTTPTLTPFHELDGEMTEETYAGRTHNDAWVIYTDGSVRIRSLPGRNIHSRKEEVDATSAVWISPKSTFNISFRTWGEATVNNAELQAIEYALRVTPRQQPLLIVTDSQYAKWMCEREIKSHEWKHLPNSLTLRRIHALLHARRQASAATKFVKVYSHIAQRLAGNDAQLKTRIHAHHNALREEYGRDMEQAFVLGNEGVDALTNKEHPARRHTTLLSGGTRFQILKENVQMSKAPFKAIKQELLARRIRKWTDKKGRRTRHYLEEYDYERTVRPILTNEIDDDSLANYMHKVLQGALNVRDVEYKITSRMEADHDHYTYMSTVYNSPWCAHCATEGLHKTETFDHLSRCPQHNDARLQLKQRIADCVHKAGGNAALLPTWYRCPSPTRPARHPARPACALLNEFDKLDGSLGYIPAHLYAALLECGVPTTLCQQLTDEIAKDAQHTALRIWRARCKTHSEELRMKHVKAKIAKEQRKSTKRKLEEPTQGNTLTRYLRPRRVQSTELNPATVQNEPIETLETPERTLTRTDTQTEIRENRSTPSPPDALRPTTHRLEGNHAQSGALQRYFHPHNMQRPPTTDSTERQIGTREPQQRAQQKRKADTLPTQIDTLLRHLRPRLTQTPLPAAEARQQRDLGREGGERERGGAAPGENPAQASQPANRHPATQTCPHTL